MQTIRILLTLSIAIMLELSAQVKEHKLPTVNFDAPEPANAGEKARRNASGKRFDGSLLVAEPHPEAGSPDKSMFVSQTQPTG